MKDRLKIKDLSIEDRPREKLLLKGIKALSEAELIAILISSGNNNQTAVELAQYILKDNEQDLNQLAKRSVSDLKKYKGIGDAKAISIVSALELGRRRKERGFTETTTLITPESVFNFMKPEMEDLHHEEFWVIFLKRNNTVIKKARISQGGVSQTNVDAKVMFRIALEEQSAGMILVHNHPSGSLKPSNSDIELTKNIKKGADILNISLIDHIIFSSEGFYSFVSEKLI